MIIVWHHFGGLNQWMNVTQVANHFTFEVGVDDLKKHNSFERKNGKLLKKSCFACCKEGKCFEKDKIFCRAFRRVKCSETKTNFPCQKLNGRPQAN